MKNTKVMPVSATLTKVAERVDDEDEKLFVRFLGSCMQGLLANNAHYCGDSMAWEECYTPEEIVNNAGYYAEELVRIVRDRREVEAFEKKLDT